MKKLTSLLFSVLIATQLNGQVFISQELDARPQSVKDEIEQELGEQSISNRSNVTYIQTVVHVLWNAPSDNISDSLVQATIDLVNKDYRRQNADTNLTPSYFLPVAADTEIELKLAQVDPNGNPTTGITHTYTDSTEFMYELGNMKFDSTGGVTAWDTDSYINIWVIESIRLNIEGGGVLLGASTFPGHLPENEMGIVLRTDRFSSSYGWRTLTHELGHFVCLLHPEAVDTCYNADFVDDTPIGQPEFAFGCNDTVITCANGPYGNMHMNFMSYGSPSCKSLFTQGQKSRILTCLETQYPGIIDYLELSFGDEEEVKSVIYPNPTSSILTIESQEKLQQVALFDLRGKQVIQFAATDKRTTIDMAHLPPGVYLLQTTNASGGVSVSKVVKE